MRPRKVVLCVDDNEMVLSLRRVVLETHGFRVITALGAENAIEAFCEERPSLVLTDLIMPGIDGNELAARLKEIDADIPVIIYSGATMNLAAASNADSFLPKGTTAAEMLDRVRLLAVRKRGPRKKEFPQPLTPDEWLRRSA